MNESYKSLQRFEKLVSRIKAFGKRISSFSMCKILYESKKPRIFMFRFRNQVVHWHQFKTTDEDKRIVAKAWNDYLQKRSRKGFNKL